MFGFDEGEFGAEEGGEMVCLGYGVEDLGLVEDSRWRSTVGTSPLRTVRVEYVNVRRGSEGVGMSTFASPPRRRLSRLNDTAMSSLYFI